MICLEMKTTNFRKTGIHGMRWTLFCHPFGAGDVMVFSRGFTPGYIPSALLGPVGYANVRKAEALPYV